jgi:hypothetical protein
MNCPCQDISDDNCNLCLYNKDTATQDDIAVDDYPCGECTYDCEEGCDWYYHI